MERAELEIVTTPTGKWLGTELRDCERRFLVGSPFVRQPLIDLSNGLSTTVKKTLVTRANLYEFAMRSSDITTLCLLSREGYKIKRLPALHAKTYIIDNRVALVTSANATNGGLFRNWELGVATRDIAQIKSLVKLVLAGYGASEPPRTVTPSELARIQAQVDVVRPKLPKRVDIDKLMAEEFFPEIEILDIDQFRKNYKGWKALVFEEVLDMPDQFKLSDVYKRCESIGRKRYPTNTEIRPKIRQQLQFLRNDGLLAFLGGGNYRKTFHAL